MSGAATFTGTNYQSHVIAHIYVHVLAQARLGWLSPFDDTPVGLSGETDGPGDDAEIHFGERHPPAEVQAKHGLTGGAKLSEAIMDVVRRSRDRKPMHVIFAVDRSSSRTVHVDFARDLQRIRSGRTDQLKNEAKRLVAELASDATLLHRLHVVALDLDNEHDPETKFTFQLLESVLQDRQQARAAWAVLLQDATEVCARRLGRTRQDLVDLLAGAGIEVRLPTKYDRLMQQLDLTKRLLASGQAEAVLTVLDAIEHDIAVSSERPVRYRFAQHRAAALLDLDRSEEALNAARQALDVDPSGIHALLAASQAAARYGDLVSATHYADRATEAAPENPDVWAAKVQIAALAGETLPTPPASATVSGSYKLALAQIAANAGDWDRLLQLTAEVLARDRRTPKILSLRIAALVNSAESDSTPAAREKLLEAERLATEAVDAFDDGTSLKTDLLVQRAEARRRLGNITESNADLARACEIDEEHPEAIGRLAQAHLNAGRTVDALQVLRSQVVDEYPMLLVMRAQATAESGDPEGARHDLDKALGRLDEAPEPDALRLFAADVALTLRDTTVAARVLESVTSDSVAPEMQATLRGRLAFAHDDIDGAIEWFYKAADRAPHVSAVILGELAGRLMRRGRAQDAVDAFRRIEFASLPEQLKSEFAGALMEANDLAGAAKVVDDVAIRGPLPDWALGIAADLAVRQGDTKRAIEALQNLYERHPDDYRVAFEIARRLIALGLIEASLPYLDALRAADQVLPPSARMDVAHLLNEAGRVDEAVALAFKAFRAARHDPAMHRGFATLLIGTTPLLPEPTEVAAETYVRFTADDGTEREYVIYADEPLDPVHKELSAVAAAKAGYLGKRLGDTFVTNPDTWERRWTVTELLPAVVYVFRDVVSHYEDRFPSEPFFLTMFKMPDEGSVRMFAPLIATLQSRRKRTEEVFRLYRESTLPLGFVAKMLDASVAEAMGSAISSDESSSLLLAEWFDAEGQEESRDAARSATNVVVTRSALETMVDLDLLERLASAYCWLAPSALLVALKHELRQAEEKAASGVRGMTSGDTGLQFEEIPAGHQLLVARADRIRKICDWIERNTRLEVRPLETIAAEDSREEEVRKRIGADSNDAVQLADHLGVAMMADDLGLRKLLGHGNRARSFSMVSLLPILAERGIVSGEDRDSMLLQLIERKYVAVPPSRALLNAGIRVANGRIREITRVFALLGGPVLQLPDAAKVAAEVMKLQVTAPVQLLSLETLVTISLEALASKWSPGLSAYSLARAAAREFSLLPQHLKTIQKATAAFLKSRE